MKRPGRTEIIKDYLIIGVAVVICSIFVYFFMLPNHFAFGGVTALAIVLDKVIPFNISVGTMVTIINILLLVIGYLVIGRDFSFKSAYGTLLFSLLLVVFENIFPLNAPLTDQPIMEMIIFCIGYAAGCAIIFNHSGTTGGTDIVAIIIKKFFGLDAGKALFFVDILIACFAFSIYGTDTGVFSFVGIFVESFLIDSLAENIYLRKIFMIITDMPEKIEEFILNMGRSATVCECKGSYTKKGKYLICSAMNRKDAVKVRRYINENNNGEFVMILNSADIYGDGFKEEI